MSSCQVAIFQKQDLHIFEKKRHDWRVSTPLNLPLFYPGHSTLLSVGTGCIVFTLSVLRISLSDNNS